jgi:hypothetical protein
VWSALDDIFQDAVEAAEALAIASGQEEVEAAILLITWAYEGSVQLADAADGTPVEGPLPLNTTADTLAQQLIDGWQTTAAALRVPDDQIVSDYTALRQFYSAGVNLQSSEVADAQTPLSYSAYAFLWRWFLGKRYPPDHARPNSGTPVTQHGPIDIKNFYCYYIVGVHRYPFYEFPEDQTFTQIEPPQYPNQNGFEAYALAGTTVSGDESDPDTTMPPRELPGALYGLPAPPGGTTPPPVDAEGNITPLGLHDQFLWHDLIYAGTKTQRIFQWYDENHPIPDVPLAERWPC